MIQCIFAAIYGVLSFFRIMDYSESFDLDPRLVLALMLINFLFVVGLIYDGISSEYK